MKEKNPVRKVREFLNSEPTDRQRNIILAITTAATIAVPLLYIAAEIVTKNTK
jgi:hypothetical protein